MGGHKLFEHFFVHEDEESWINGAFPLSLDYIKTLVIEQPCEILKDFNIESYQIFQGKPDRILKDHDMIEFGGRKLEVLHTPGHSPGHMCFYESQTGYLFTGDLIYEGKMIAFFPTSDPTQYKVSVDKLSTIPAKRLLPAHHKLDIEIDMLTRIQSAFNEIEDNGKLRHCGQTFEFDGFQIQM
ncbi:MBL fold metallo-hydrolase [Clostridium subterminale]|uniref:MBL fold metallo-hydrolase n=1 Tax=Clostridium subterminale TaxID=1550 RepID=UPI0031DE831B